MLQKAEHKREEHERREGGSRPERAAVGEPVAGSVGEGRPRRGDRAPRGSGGPRRRQGPGSEPWRGRPTSRAGGIAAAGTKASAPPDRRAMNAWRLTRPTRRRWRRSQGPATSPARSAPSGRRSPAADEQRTARPRLPDARARRTAPTRRRCGRRWRRWLPTIELLAVEVRQSHSFLEVQPELVDAAVDALHGKELDGKQLTAERARRRRR